MMTCHLIPIRARLAFKEGQGYHFPPRIQEPILGNMEGHVQLKSISANGNKKEGVGPKVMEFEVHF